MTVKRIQEIIFNAFLQDSKQAKRIITEIKLPNDETGYGDTYRLFFAWIRFLRVSENFERHLSFTRNLQEAFGKVNFPIRVYPRRSFLYQQKDGYNFNECLITMSRDEVKRMVQSIKVHSETYSNLIRECAIRPEAVAVSRFFISEVQRTAEDDSIGRFVNLNDVFNRVNQSMFEGKFSRPLLCWSTRNNHRVMGSYNPDKDQITINCLLDARKTPAYVLDFLMYHEMLHKLLGVKTVNGRRQVHSAEFRRLEKVHPDYQRANEYLDKLPQNE